MSDYSGGKGLAALGLIAVVVVVTFICVAVYAIDALLRWTF